ncbi:MAG: glycosyltransferase family 2 protein [Bacteroidota bacterium]
MAIAYNEERDLPGFLSHLLPWVDEIVIVDDGSTDATARLAEEAGAKVTFLQSPRNEGEYYSDQRNKGIDAAQSDWLLHMDIDERVPPALAHEILQAIRDPGFDGYRFRRLNFMLHRPMRGGGLQNWNLVHLARRSLFRFGGKMHETCLLDAPPERVGQLRERIWHLNEISYEKRLKKSWTYSAIRCEDILESGRRVRWYDLLLRPMERALAKYFWHGGWRDGTMGLLYALHCFDATFRSWTLAWDAQNAIPRTQLDDEIMDLWARDGTDLVPSTATARTAVENAAADEPQERTTAPAASPAE